VGYGEEPKLHTNFGGGVSQAVQSSALASRWLPNEADKGVTTHCVASGKGLEERDSDDANVSKYSISTRPRSTATNLVNLMIALRLVWILLSITAFGITLPHAQRIYDYALPY
jgi:hypothetical protein